MLTICTDIKSADSYSMKSTNVITRLCVGSFITFYEINFTLILLYFLKSIFKYVPVTSKGAYKTFDGKNYVLFETPRELMHLIAFDLILIFETERFDKRIGLTG